MPYQYTCAECGTPFKSSRKNRKYCSLRCYRGVPENRFWQRVSKDGPVPSHVPCLGPCWEWTGSQTGKGYGRIKCGKKMYSAHRFSWGLHYGPVPDGLWVLHKCDNPRCVRPDHLFVGTPLDNMRDMVKKGRGKHDGRKGIKKRR